MVLLRVGVQPCRHRSQLEQHHLKKEEKKVHFNIQIVLLRRHIILYCLETNNLTYLSLALSLKRECSPTLKDARLAGTNITVFENYGFGFFRQTILRLQGIHTGSKYVLISHWE